MISKTLSIIFGVGLIGLWVVAISVAGTSAWLTWIDGGIGVVGVILGLALTSNSPKSLRSGGPILLALCLFVLCPSCTLPFCVVDHRTFRNGNYRVANLVDLWFCLRIPVDGLCCDFHTDDAAPAGNCIKLRSEPMVL